MQPDDEELLARLHEDSASPDEAQALLPTMKQLRAWEAPQPTRQDTEGLLTRLRSELPRAPFAHSNTVVPIFERPALWLDSYWPWLLLRSQAKVVRGEIWTVSALVMLIGTLVTLLTYGPNSTGATLPLVLLAPVMAAVGVGYLYGAAADPALEVLLAAPTSPRLILLARLVLVYSFNLLLGLSGSALLAVLEPNISLWPLIMAWLAPMAFLSALALLITVLTTDPAAGALISLGVWALHTVRQEASLMDFLWYLPDLAAPQARPWLWGTALICAALAFWKIGRSEQWLGERKW